MSLRYETGLPAFGALVLGTYVLFVDWQPRSRVVTWSDESPFCSRFVRVFRRLDWFGVHEFVRSDRLSAPREVDDALRLDGPGERASGFVAIRMMLERSPVTFLFAPLLRLWPVAAAGRRAFRRLASHAEYQAEPSEA